MEAPGHVALCLVLNPALDVTIEIYDTSMAEAFTETFNSFTILKLLQCNSS